MIHRLGIIALFALPAHAAPPEVALLTDLLGRVEIRQEPAPWRPATLEEGLLLGDAVRTWERSNAEIRFVDGTMLMLSERTRVRISTALFNPGEAPPPIQVALAAGALDVRTGRAPLEVQVDGGGARRIEPGVAAHVEVRGEGSAGQILVGPPRMPVTTDFAPPPVADTPERPEPEPAVERNAPDQGGNAAAGPAPPAPEAPPPPFDEPLVEPEEETPPSAPTRVRIRVKVRAEGGR